jgi:hypothetical protein
MGANSLIQVEWSVGKTKFGGRMDSNRKRILVKETLLARIHKVQK